MSSIRPVSGIPHLTNTEEMKQYSVVADTETGELRFYEVTANGTNYVGLRAPSNIVADKMWKLPAADGAENEALVTDGSGNLAFLKLTSGAWGAIYDADAYTELTTVGEEITEVNVWDNDQKDTHLKKVVLTYTDSLVSRIVITDYKHGTSLQKDFTYTDGELVNVAQVGDMVGGSNGNTIIYGTVAPTTEGVNGDSYINTTNHYFYGPKSNGTWPSGTSLVGPAGSNGTNGTNGTNGADGKTVLYGTVAPTTEGVDGDFYIRTTTNYIYGPKASGTWPSGTSLVGPAGLGTTGSVASGSIAATSGAFLLVDTSSAPATVTLPATPAAGDYVLVSDAKWTFATNKCTIARNGNKIMGATADYDIATNGKMYRIAYVDAAYGWVIFEDDCWEDLRVPLYARSGGTAPAFTSGFAGNATLYSWHFVSGQVNNMYFEAQLPHGWKGTTIYPHVHWSPTTTNTGTVRWRLEYTWVNIDGTFGASSTVDMEEVVSTNSQWKHMLIGTVSGIAPSGSQSGISSMLICRLYRDPTVTTGSNLAANVALLAIDFHYQTDALGSRQMTAR